MDEPKTNPVNHEHTHELLDEVLQHTSQQALRLSHLDEGMADLRVQMAALREESTQRRPSASTSPTGFGGANEQVDSIERDARAARSKVSWLTALVCVQTVMLGVLVFIAFRPTRVMPPPTFAPVAEAAAAPKPAPAAAAPTGNPFAGSPDSPDATAAKPEPSADVTKSEVKKKKKRK